MALQGHKACLSEASQLSGEGRLIGLQACKALNNSSIRLAGLQACRALNTSSTRLAGLQACKALNTSSLRLTGLQACKALNISNTRLPGLQTCKAFVQFLRLTSLQAYINFEHLFPVFVCVTSRPVTCRQITNYMHIVQTTGHHCAKGPLLADLSGPEDDEAVLDTTCKPIKFYSTASKSSWFLCITLNSICGVDVHH